MEELKHIVRIIDTDLVGEKPLFLGLRKIKGIDFMFSNLICSLSKIDPNKKVGYLNDEEVKEKFKDVGDAAKDFGNSVSDYFKDEKEDGMDTEERVRKECLSVLLGIPETAIQFPSILHPNSSPFPPEIHSQPTSSFSSKPKPFPAFILLQIAPPNPPSNQPLFLHHCTAIPPLKSPQKST